METNEKILKDIEQELSSISQNIKVYNELNVIIIKNDKICFNIIVKENNYELKVCIITLGIIFNPCYQKTIEELINQIKFYNSLL